MKALILAGGRGERLGDLTKNSNKCMLLLKGKPVLEYNLRRASEIPEVNEIILVVGYRAEDIINKYGTTFSYTSDEGTHIKKIRYVIQRNLEGLVHAIQCAREAIGEDDIFLLLGDEVFQNSRHREMIRLFSQYKDDPPVDTFFGFCGVVSREKGKTEEIRKTYAILLDDVGNILRLIEKPQAHFNHWQGTGHCVFKNEILGYLNKTPIHPKRGERELPDLIQCAIDEGKMVKLFRLAEDYTNINSEEDLREAEKFELG